MVVDNRKMRGCLTAAALIAMVLPAGATAGVIQDVRASAAEVAIGERLEIRFRLSEPAATTVSIYDSDMRLVRAYDLGQLQPGPQSLAWDGRDGTGEPVAPEAYAWRVEARTSSGTDTWEPAGLYSRTMEHIGKHQWDAATRTISYRTPSPMRIWVRIGVWMGACVRLLVEGEPRPAGVVNEIWDGLDETRTVDILGERKDWVVSVFGYRLPTPCVMVTGAGPLPQPSFDRAFLSRLNPPVTASAPPWHRRRTFLLADHMRPTMQLVQLDREVFVAELRVPKRLGLWEKAILQRTLGRPIGLKWFIDGHCAAEDVDAVMPSMITLPPDQVPKDGGRHFITANLVTAMQEIAVASLWIN